MKRKIGIVLLIILLLVFFLLAGYFLLAFYYRQGFTLNTWINGVYCTGKSVEEVNSELLSKVEAPIVIITDNEGTEYEINLEDVGYQVDYLTSLQQFREDQNPYLWIDNVTFHKNHDLAPQVSYDKDAFQDLFYELDFVQTEDRLTDYMISYDEKNGYQLYDGLSGRLDVEKALQAVLAAIDAGEMYIDLQAEACYQDIPLNQEQKEMTALWEKIAYFQNCDLVYDMGDTKIEFTPDVMATFLLTENNLPILDEEGKLVLDEEAVENFVSELADDFDTYGKERKFMSTRGEEITLTKGTYGSTLDQKTEVEYLSEILFSEEIRAGVAVEHIPEYRREAFVRGKDDIGGTYIEIDMTEQKLYCYVDYELQLETDIVTGNLSRKMGTPSGVYYVYNKQTDRVLRGPGYASPVDYWMPVKGGIGIHDASWRKKFGGEIYKTNGSHGCINVPTDVMPEIYEMMEIGTPVIMFY